MARVLLVAISRLSHMTPLAPTYRWLESRGHHVDVALSLGAPPTNADLDGIRWSSQSPEEFRSTFTAPAGAGAGGGESILSLRDPVRRAQVYGEVLLADIEARTDFIERAIARHRPDVVAGDPLSYDGPIAAARHGIPWIALGTDFAPASTATAAEDPFEAAVDILTPVVRARLQGLGFSGAFRAGGVVSPELNLIPGLDAWFSGHGLSLRGVGAPPAHVSGVVPRRFPDRPLVVIAFGSAAQLPVSYVETFVRAARGVDAEFLLGARGFARDYALPLPPHVQCASFIPQAAALQQAALAIHHGGANSFLECAALGVPQIIAPLHGDQFGSARLGEKLGIARAVDAATLTVDQLGTHLHALLRGEPQRKLALRRVAANLASVRYADRIGRAIEQVIYAGGGSAVAASA